MPTFSAYVVCRDWQSVWNKDANNPFEGTLKPGYLYRWDEYGSVTPQPIGRFEEIQEFRMDREMSLFENPTYGWVLHIPPWEDELFPQPGETFEITLDGSAVRFVVNDAEVSTTYTRREPSGELHMEDRVETRRLAIPVSGHAQTLLQWIERHHNIPEARQNKTESLADPKRLYKDKVLRIMLRVIGLPKRGRYEFVPSLGAI